MPVNWEVLNNVPLLLYILAAKTLLLCLAFAGVKHYQSRRLQQEQEKARRLKAEEKKER